MLRIDKNHPRPTTFGIDPINPEFEDNLLTIKEKGLLFVEQPSDFSLSFPLGGDWVNPLEHLKELLRIIRDIYKNKNREIE